MGREKRVRPIGMCFECDPARQVRSPARHRLRHHNHPSDHCPVCGNVVTITGRTADGRLIGSCRDAFTVAQWVRP